MLGFGDEINEYQAKDQNIQIRLHRKFCRANSIQTHIIIKAKLSMDKILIPKNLL